jgi:PAS domain S-box-containing protein
MTDATNGGRTRAYEALRESEELHRATLGNISDAVFLTDDAGTYSFICPNVDVIFGYDPDEVQTTLNISRLLGENLFDLAELKAKGEIRNVEREITAKSGEQRTVLIHVKCVAIRGATVLYTCRDITELKHAERDLSAARLELARASRLALVSQLMASIVHEVMQPLTAIWASSEAALLKMSRRGKNLRHEDLREILSNIRDQSDGATKIVDQLRGLIGKHMSLDLRTLDMNRAVRDVMRLIHADAFRRGVTIQVDLATSLPAVRADRVSLHQVILNLMVNAMDATDQKPKKERLVIVRTRSSDDIVELEVSDTGSGISADHRAKLFEAFFTTKTEGVGVGLAIARSIAEAHGGRIWAEERSGPGATFRLTLPLQHEQSSVATRDAHTSKADNRSA